MTQPAPVPTTTIPPAILARMLEDVHADTPDGYEVFYQLVWNRPVPEHCMDWVRRIYGEERADRPVFLEAFRGSTKSTTITVTLAAYKIGNHPEKCGYIINAVDEKANEFAEAIKSIIEHNIAWQLCFPSIVPDYARGWAQDGYNVKDNRVDYGEWVRKLSPDPTFVGYGAKSGSITGKHPSNWLIVDDIHNEENTRSSAEIQAIKDNYNAVINYTREPNNPLTIIVGTPWNDNDLYADIRGSKAYFHIRTPARKEDGIPTWPEGFGEEKIQKKLDEDLSGGVEPARMLFLDLNTGKQKVFHFQEIEADQIKAFQWPVQGGVDYASVVDPTKRNNTQSHFALAYVCKSPSGRAMVYGGELLQCSMAEGMELIVKAQSMFPNWLHCEIEGDGKGEDFFQHLMMHPSLRVNMSKTGGKSKAHRLVNLLGPWLRLGKILISNANTPFLNAARNFMNKYPAVGEHDPGWDVMDSIYRACVAMPDILILEKSLDEMRLPSRKQKTPSPWASVGAMRV